MINDKIKGMMGISGVKAKDLAMALGVTEAGMRNKLSKNSFTAQDLVQICDCCNASLTMVLQDGSTIKFDTEDIKK